MTGFECFSLYQAIKLHFTSSYDYFKYNGKTNVKLNIFENRKDKYFFLKLSRKYPNKEVLIDFLIANFLVNDKIWIGDLLSDESDTIFLQRQKFLQSLSYQFESDCRTLFGDESNPNNILKTSGDYPILLTTTLRKEVHFETLCILNMILNFLPMWKNKISDTIRWPDYCRKIEKYSGFLPQDHIKYKSLLRKVIL